MAELGKALLGLGVLLVIVGAALAGSAVWSARGAIAGRYLLSGEERVGVLAFGHVDCPKRRAFGDLLSDFAVQTVRILLCGAI